MADEEVSKQPSLWDQTLNLGELLRALSEKDPVATPSPAAKAAFQHWLDEGARNSSEARYFEDVAENFDVEKHTIGEVFDLFEILHPYLEIAPPEDDLTESDPPARTFINLPLSTGDAG
ncbi:MAG: hypothetical protein P4L33_12550 [Capsulimonadaceae bacterium]|nr:hypothetical protein [Capsulimonadaceae bacterium]